MKSDYTKEEIYNFARLLGFERVPERTPLPRSSSEENIGRKVLSDEDKINYLEKKNKDLRKDLETQKDSCNSALRFIEAIQAKLDKKSYDRKDFKELNKQIKKLSEQNKYLINRSKEVYNLIYKATTLCKKYIDQSNKRDILIHQCSEANQGARITSIKLEGQLSKLQSSLLFDKFPKNSGQSSSSSEDSDSSSVSSVSDSEFEQKLKEASKSNSFRLPVPRVNKELKDRLKGFSSKKSQD